MVAATRPLPIWLPSTPPAIAPTKLPCFWLLVPHAATASGTAIRAASAAFSKYIPRLPGVGLSRSRLAKA